jgi:hypothetical protein
MHIQQVAVNQQERIHIAWSQSQLRIELDLGLGSGGAECHNASHLKEERDELPRLQSMEARLRTNTYDSSIGSTVDSMHGQELSRTCFGKEALWSAALES